MENVTKLYPLYFLPSVNYMRQVLSKTEVILSIGERYKKQTPRSRFEIAGPNNRQLISIPVIHPGNYASVCLVKLDNSENWQLKHWRSIETAYRKAPFFEFYAHHFEPLFQKKFSVLAELNLEALHTLFKILKSDTRVILDMHSIETLNTVFSEHEEPYFQVFEKRHGFMPQLSILDLIFNEGPGSLEYLRLD